MGVLIINDNMGVPFGPTNSTRNKKFKNILNDNRLVDIGFINLASK